MKPPTTTLLEHLHRLTRPTAADAVLIDRWVHQRDEQAFAALVARHGPMVLGVCRRILGDAHESEDAMQATFLILARKAASLRRPEALACWLHGVAARLAYKSRAAAKRRTSHSRNLAAEPADSHPDPLDLLTVREMLGLIDEEIRALREAYRLPLLLCDLEGRTQEEAAGLLGWTLGSLRGRLLRGREKLRSRLARRGLTLPAGGALPLVPAALSESMSAAGPVVTPLLVATLTHTAVGFSTDSAAAQASGPAVDLAKEGLRILWFSKVKIAAAMVLLMTVFVVGAGLLRRQKGEATSVAASGPLADSQASRLPLRPDNEKPQVHLDRFGDPLPEGAVARLGTVRLRHGREVRSVAFSPDGKTLASGGQDNTVRLWDIATGKESHRFTATTGPGADIAWVQSIAFSPDGKFLAAATGNGAGGVVIWDLATKKVARRLSGFLFPPIFSLAYSPDGKTLAAGTYAINASIINLWDVQTGQSLRHLQGHKELIESVAFAPDGKTLASGSRDKTICLWDTATGRQLRQLQGHTDRVLAVAFTSDGKTLASGSWDNTIRIWDATTGKELRVLKGHSGAVSTLAFLPESKTLASGSWDWSIRLWDTAAGKELRQLRGHTGSVPGIAVSSDGKMIASGSWDRIVRIWDVATGKERRPTEGNRAGLGAVAVSPDGKHVATGGEEGVIRLWDSETGEEMRRLREPGIIGGSGVGGTWRMTLGDHLQFSADGKILTVPSGAQLGLWDTKTGKQIRGKRYEPHHSLSPTPDDKFVIGHDWEGNVSVLDAATGKTIRQFKASKKDFISAVSADSKFLACGSAKQDGTVVIWELATGKERCRCKGTPQIPYTLTFSPGDKYLAGTMANYQVHTPATTIFLWDAATGREIRHFQTRGHYVFCQTYSSDGRMLATGGGDKSIRLWEIATGKERRRFDGHQGGVNSVAFSSDGTRLVSASDDTTALVWDATAPTPAGKPTAEQLQAAWSDLASDDAAKAYRALWLLARNPKESLPLLRENMPPARAVDAEMRKQVERWLTDLDSDQATVREQASTELEKRVVIAEPMLRKALTARPSLEQRKRIERVLERLEQERVTMGRALEVLEHAHTPESRQLLEKLAAGEPEAWLTCEAKTTLRMSRREP